MTMNFTLITSIVLTAALASAGTYYISTRVQPVDSSVESVAVQPPQTATQPVTVAVNKETNKPVEVIVRTEIVHKERKHKQIDHVAQSRAAILAKQPHLEVLH